METKHVKGGTYAPSIQGQCQHAGCTITLVRAVDQPDNGYRNVEAEATYQGERISLRAVTWGGDDAAAVLAEKMRGACKLLESGLV